MPTLLWGGSFGTFDIPAEPQITPVEQDVARRQDLILKHRHLLGGRPGDLRGFDVFLCGARPVRVEDAAGTCQGMHLYLGKLDPQGQNPRGAAPRLSMDAPVRG